VKHLILCWLLIAALPTGWTTTQTPTPPISVPARFACPDDFTDFLPPVLSIGMIGATIARVDDAENLRRFPVGTAPVVGELPEGTLLEAVIAGPACFDGIVWWYVEAAGLAGWTPESDAATGDYFISAADADIADADSDGVEDALDFCPENGTADPVDELGCPLPTSAAPAVVAVTAVGEGDLRVDTHNHGITLINVGDDAINPALLTFTSATAQFNGADWNLNTLRPGDCVQIYHTGTHRPHRPADCRSVQSWLERGLEHLIFWDEPFTFSYDGVEIATCPEVPNDVSTLTQCEALLP